MFITLITPTGGRPKAFALCERWMERQTKRWYQWIVVDDCAPPTPTHLGQTVVQLAPAWQLGENTQARNLLEGLRHVKGDAVLFIEDDDWYSPAYIEQMSAWLELYSVVGCSAARYYNLNAQKFQYMQNQSHSSLCETGLRTEREVMRLLDKTIRAPSQLKFELVSPRFIDCVFWQRVRRSRINWRLYTHHGLCIGIKGLPGRMGIGTGHTPGNGYEVDEGFSRLREWIGDDVDIYREVLSHV